MADAAPIWGAGCRRLLVALLSVGVLLRSAKHLFLAARTLGCARKRRRALVSSEDCRLIASVGDWAVVSRERQVADQTWRSPSTTDQSGRLHWSSQLPIGRHAGLSGSGWSKNGSDRGREGQMFGGKEQAAREGSATKRHDNDLAQIPFRGPMHPAGRNDRGYRDRYYYRPHVGGELTFVDKESPAIHLTPCPACPDWPASQQRGSAVGTNSR